MRRLSVGSGLAVWLSCAWVMMTPSAGRGDCVLTGNVATLLSPTTAVPQHASLLGALVLGSREGHRDVFPSDVYITRGTTRMTLRVANLAPGLVRLDPDGTPELGVWQLFGIGEPSLVTFVGTPLPAPPPTPRIRNAELHVRTSGGFDAGTYHRNVARLNEPVPNGAVALVNYLRGPATPRSWGRARAGEREVTYFSDPVRCGLRVPGQRVTPLGSQAGVFAYVDAWAQLSSPARPNRGPVEAATDAP